MGLRADLVQDVGLRDALVGDLDADALALFKVVDTDELKGLLRLRHIGGGFQLLLGRRSGAAHRALDGQRVAGQGFVQQVNAGVGNDRCIPAHVDTSVVIL